MVSRYKGLFWIIIILGIVGVSGFWFVKKNTSYPVLSSTITQENIVPLMIIGSGPAGLSAAVYGARANLHTIVIEGGKPGGLLTETTMVENWPGEISILGNDIIMKLKNQAKHLGAQFLNDSVQSVDCSTWPFTVHTNEGITLHALSIIVATGANPRKLNIPGEQEYWSKGVTACAVCDAPFFKDKNVVVIGGGDSAAEEALQLASYARHITILVRGERMRAAARMQEHLNQYPHIKIHYNVAIKEIVGDGRKVTGLELVDKKTNATEHMPIDGVFLAIGHEPNSALFKSALKTDEVGYIVVECPSQKTSIPGIFAAGDVEDRWYRQAGVAAGSGIKAALDAANFLSEVGFNTTRAQELQPYYFYPSSVKKSAAIELVKQIGRLQEIIAGKGLVIVDFYADYCPSCIQMLPIVESVANNFAGQMTFVKVDVEQAPDIVREFFVQKIPCLLIFKDGALAARYTRAMTKQELTAFVEQFLIAK